MNQEVLQVFDPGFGASIQDRGRFGWRRFGVPVSGAMDEHAAAWANRLLENAADAPLLELLLQGGKLSVLQDSWIAITGADADATVPMWRAIRAQRGEAIQFRQNRSGVWTYLAVEGGIHAPRILGSASVYARGKIGEPLAKGAILCKTEQRQRKLPPEIAGQFMKRQEIRRYDAPPPMRVWRGPQWESFGYLDRDRFFTEPWTVSSQSDRTGYRLSGPALRSPPAQIISEPVRVGSIQVPPSGQPIVLMKDGPTVGGYPKLGMIDPQDVSWLAQCRPGQKVRFQYEAGFKL